MRPPEAAASSSVRLRARRSSRASWASAASGPCWLATRVRVFTVRDGAVREAVRPSRTGGGSPRAAMAVARVVSSSASLRATARRRDWVASPGTRPRVSTSRDRAAVSEAPASPRATATRTSSGVRRAQVSRVRWESMPRKPPSATDDTSNGIAPSASVQPASAHAAWSRSHEGPSRSTETRARPARSSGTPPRASTAAIAASWSAGSRTAARSTRTTSAVSGSDAAASDRSSMARMPARSDGAWRTASRATRVDPALCDARSMIEPYPTGREPGPGRWRAARRGADGRGVRPGR